MTAFGGTAIDQYVTDGFEGVKNAALELQLFEMLGQLPLTSITSFVGIVLVMVFFITSSDSGSLVIDSITPAARSTRPVPSACSGASSRGPSPSPCCWVAA